jgi:hypothetical protein
MCFCRHLGKRDDAGGCTPVRGQNKAAVSVYNPTVKIFVALIMQRPPRHRMFHFMLLSLLLNRLPPAAALFLNEKDIAGGRRRSNKLRQLFVRFSSRSLYPHSRHERVQPFVRFDLFTSNGLLHLVQMQGT